MQLTQALRRLHATGHNGFEGLIHRLVERLTGYPLYLARSGDQSGRDMRSGGTGGSIIAVECKRYRESTALEQAELVGKLAEAKTTMPMLDIWVLVASRPVSDQVYTAIERLAGELRIGFAIVSTGDGTPSTLAALCANASDIVRTFLSRLPDISLDACDEELRQIQADPGYQDVRARLERNFSRSAIYEWWRRHGHRSFIDSLASSRASHAAFGQLLDVRAKTASSQLVTRVDAQARLNRWYDGWPASHQGFALLGEEGDGKTWAVASWLMERCQLDSNFPPILWFSSYRVTIKDPRRLVSDALAPLLELSADHCSGHLDRWRNRHGGPGPGCVLVFDGLNERHQPAFWRELLQNLATIDWASFAAVLLTTRTTHWDYFRPLQHLQITDWTLRPFDDAEFDVALRMSGLAAADIPAETLAVARKPRYFDLVVRHRARLTEVGDVTVVRLIYEDWRDRFERKASLPFDDGRFQQLLKDLARKSLARGPVLSDTEVAALVPPFVDGQATLSELSTGGILVPEGGRLKVEPGRLRLGFGLLLAEQLQDSPSSPDAPELDQVAAGWLESMPDTDVRAGICEAAALHALSSSGFSVRVRATLLTCWLRARNQQGDIINEVSAYFPLAPDAYFAAAEILWTDPQDDPWAQQALMNTFARWSKSDRHHARFVTIFEHWLGLVPLDGSPYGSPEGRRRWQERLAEQLGHELVPGSLAFGGLTLTVVSDTALTRLGRVALALISSLGDRGPFLQALIIGSLAEAIVPERYEILAWVIRSSPRSMASDIARGAQMLIADGRQTALRGAFYLLSFEGSLESITLRNTLPTDLFPRDDDWGNLKRDCASGFSWTREMCSACAGRDDINLFHLAQQVQRFSPEEGFQIPESACKRLRAAAASFDVSRVHVGPAQGEPDVRLDELEPGLAACAPEAIADVYRRLAREVTSRQGRELMLLLFFLGEHILILRDAERAVLDARWRQLQAACETEDRTERLNEAVLVMLLLSGMTGSEQLSLLLSRRPSDCTLVALTPWISPTTDEEVVAALSPAITPHAVQRLVNFVATQPEAPSEAVALLVAPFVTQADAWTRASVLEIVRRSGSQTAAASVVNGAWHWTVDGHAAENHFGSSLLAECGGALTYDDVRNRIDPALLGFAVDRRGLRPTEVERLAVDLDRIWQAVIREAPLPPPDFPATELRVDTSSPVDRVERIGLAAGVLSERITVRASHSIWGGSAGRTPQDGVFSQGEQSVDDRLDQLQGTLRDTLKQQRAAGNIWFGQRFSTHGLAAVFAARPDLLDAWLRPILEDDHPDHLRALTLARSFYESTCRVLLHVDPSRGVRLYTALRDAPELTSTLVGFASLDDLDLSLFGAPESEPVVAAWQGRLHQARSDADLLAISTLAQRGTASRWLERTVRLDLPSPRPFAAARALTLCGFIDTAWASEVLQAYARLSEETWHGAVAREAMERRISDQAAQYRFHQLMRDPNPDRAWAGYRLLLRVVDRRIAIWYERIEHDAVDSKRVAFLISNTARIAQAIEKNEDRFRKTFLGQQTREGQAWPWME